MIDLINGRKVTEVSLSDYTSIQMDGAAVWGGALWEVRQLLKQDLADKLLLSAWAKLKPSTNPANSYNNFVRAILDAERNLDGGIHSKEVREILKRRGI